MAGEWRETTLGEVTTWTSGGTPSKSNPAYWGGGIPWISAASMKFGRIESSGRRLSEEGLVNGSRLAPKDSVLLLVRGSELHKRIPVGIATKDVAFNQDVKALRARDGLEPHFLYYWLAGSEPVLLSKVEPTGIGAGKLDSSVLKSLPLRLPPLAEQRAIAHILGTLDDKIELNRKQNETLEAMARALFKAWFVDFEPVRAKMEGRWQRGQSLPGLPAQLYDLFPDRLVESELGEIPEGWSISTLDETCNYLNRGISPKYINSGGVLVLNQKCIRDFSIDFSKARRHDPTEKKIDGRTLEIGDVLVNSTGVGTLGRVAQVRRLSEATIVDSHVTVVRPGPQINSAYLGCFMQLKQSEIEEIGEGSTGQTELSRAKLGRVKILLPRNDALDEFSKHARILTDRISANQKNSETLAQLRDFILPKLISGDLRIADAEAFHKWHGL